MKDVLLFFLFGLIPGFFVPAILVSIGITPSKMTLEWMENSKKETGDLPFGFGLIWIITGLFRWLMCFHVGVYLAHIMRIGSNLLSVTGHGLLFCIFVGLGFGAPVLAGLCFGGMRKETTIYPAERLGIISRLLILVPYVLVLCRVFDVPYLHSVTQKLLNLMLKFLS